MAFDFKKMVADDRRPVFLNLAEFGEEHKVDGKTIPVVLADNALKKRQGGPAPGAWPACTADGAACART